MRRTPACILGGRGRDIGWVVWWTRCKRPFAIAVVQLVLVNDREGVWYNLKEREESGAE